MPALAPHFPLPWSAYVRLLSVSNESAREFYEAEALAGGWTVRQFNRQVDSQFYERTALSRDKEAMLLRGRQQDPGDIISPEAEFKDPYLLEFLGLKDEYSESDLEEALVRHLEDFLLELGGDFCFVGRQRRLRVGDEWYRVDLLFYNRKLRCAVLYLARYFGEAQVLPVEGVAQCGDALCQEIGFVPGDLPDTRLGAVGQSNLTTNPT